MTVNVVLMRPHALLAAALRPTGSAALTTCTVLPLLLTAPLSPRRPSSWRWPRTGSVDLMRPPAQLAAALRPTGSAALTTCTVLPLLLTAPSKLLAIICQSLQNLTKWSPSNLSPITQYSRHKWINSVIEVLYTFFLSTCYKWTEPLLLVRENEAIIKGKLILTLDTASLCLHYPVWADNSTCSDNY